MPLCPHCGYYYEEGELYNNTCPRCRNQVEDEASKLWGRDRRGRDVKGSFRISFEILKNNFFSAFLFWLIPLTIAVGLQIYLLFSTANMMEGFTTGDPMTGYNEMIRFYMMFLPLSLLQWIIQLLFIGGIIGMAKQGFTTGKMNVMDGFSVMKKYPVGIVGAGILLQLIVTFGLCLCIIPGVLFCYWWLFTIPAIVIEGKNISSAMDRSKNFAKSNSTGKFTVALIILVLIIQIVPSIFLTIGVQPYGNITETSIMQVSYEEIIIQVVIQIISALVLIYSAITITVHFLRNIYTAYTPFQEDVSFKPPPPPVNYNY